MAEYFTDKEYGKRPRNIEEIDERVWTGLLTLIRMRIDDGTFGYRFPLRCPDGNAAYGCDEQAFKRILSVEVPWLDWPPAIDEVPETPVILDLLVFCAEAAGKPISDGHHGYFNHDHLKWDREPGLASFAADVNRLFARSGVGFEMKADGGIQRLMPEAFAEIAGWTVYQTGDYETDTLLERSMRLIKSAKIDDRKDGLEKIWDAFERIKTIEPGANKKVQADALLDRVATSGSRFRQELGTEASALTSIGNTFRIRHSETGQENLRRPEYLDYLFFRMMSFIQLALKTTGRTTS